MMTESDPGVIATTVVERARDGRFDDIAELFAAPLAAVVSAESLRVDWMNEISRLGTISAIGTPVGEPGKAGLVRVSVPVTCERGGLTVIMSIDHAGKLNGLRLTAPETSAWTPPRYAVPKRFTEQDVTIGSGPLAVPGTLTLPRGRGPHPGVVLLTAGPFDRDLTTGPNKPFKDLAWGLASRGIAVARFDKITFTHGEVATEPGFTAVEEYVPHAIAAARLLRQQASVDPARVFILGHSGGGKAAPRVAAAEPSIAGVVILAGDTQPMSQAVIRVARYLADLSPGPESAAALEGLTRQAAAVENPDLSPATPATDLLFGWPASYWLDLRAYDPVKTAATLNKPMLILQGGRDYQVTVADDLPRWQETLGGRPDVTIHVHEADDHMFFAGTGPSTPAQYESPRHVDPAVVADIAEWLTPKGRFARVLARVAHRTGVSRAPNSTV